MIGVVEELNNGVTVYQATDEKEDASNIYCERCYGAPNGSCFVYARHGRENETHYVACDFGSWKKWVITESETVLPVGCEMANGGLFYYGREAANGHCELVAVDLVDRTKRVVDLPNNLLKDKGIILSAGERYIAWMENISFSPRMFGINLLDLKTGKQERIHEDPDICNPHLQFEPKDGKYLMVQHNRGCEFTPEGKCLRLAGDEGATIFFLEVPSGRVIRPQIGPPHTCGISGHETWMGTSGEVILTLNTTGDYDFGRGPLLCVRPDTEKPREVCAPYQANHIGVDMDGRLFAAESHGEDIVLGCARTGRTVPVCAPQIRYTRIREEPQSLADHHPHPYVSAGCRWIVFNSDRNGTLQVYVASLPEEMISTLER